MWPSTDFVTFEHAFPPFFRFSDRKIKEVLANNLQKCNADLTHARQEAVVSAFKLKKVMENHKLQTDQIERLKGTVDDLRKELAASKGNYEEIVKWAKTTEEAHRKHDDEVHDTMNKQHEKFNVEYEFLGKQNKVLKEEVRSVNHELKDAKALLEHAMEQMKDLHRETNSSKAAEKRLKKKVEELQRLIVYSGQNIIQLCHQSHNL